MKKLLLSAVLTLTFSSFSHAISLEDPHSIMDEVNYFKEARSFKNEFKVGDRVKTVSNSCWTETDTDGNTSSGCDALISDIKVNKVNANEAFFNNNFAISKTYYERLDRNPINILLEMNEIETFLVSKQLSPSESIMRLNSFEESYSAELGANIMTVKFTMISETEDFSFEFPMYVVLAQGLPFLGQIAEFSIDEDLADVPSTWEAMYKVIDWVKFF